MTDRAIDLRASETVGWRRVNQIMTPDVQHIDEASTIGSAAAEMEQRRVSYLLVARDKESVAIVTERDVVRALGEGMSPEEPVSGIMTTRLVTVAASEEVHSAYHLMAVNGIRHLVVVENGVTVGVVGEADFRRHGSLERFVGLTDVSKAMSQSYVILPGTQSMREAARAMQQSKVGCVLVAEDGRPQGIVTERDMVALFRKGAADTLLQEVMTQPVICVSPDFPLIDAVRKMQESQVRHLAVTGQDGKLVGVLNEHDTVRQMDDEFIQLLQQLVIRQARELNENKFYAVVNQLPHQVLVKDIHSTYVSCNESFAKEFNIHPDEVAGKTDFDFVPKELAEKYREDDRKVIEGAVTLVQEERLVKDGKEFWIHMTKAPIRDKAGSVIGVVAMYYDITEQKHVRYRMERDAWAMAVVNAANKSLLFAADERRLLQGICEAITLEDRYALAWVGWARQDAERSIEILASAGSSLGYLENLRVGWGEDELGNGPTGRSIRSGHSIVNRDTRDNLSFHPWLERAEKFHIRSSLSVPFRMDEEYAGALVIYAREVDAFHETEVKLFESLADNLGYGLHSRRMAQAYESEMKERVSLASKLEASLEGALMAISATLEQRDPYTAGHERSVADLAVKIGQELRLDASQLKALYLAAIVHDIGKIQVPAEILTKPGRLHANEYSLIKLHAECGYNILSNIDFPWPIAEIIRQHHEYLDGSGYPRGLKADEILLPARILTVADIVESMSSDRPYRPALGLSEAVDEIIKMRGTKLDPDVVDACVRVIERNEFLPSHLQLAP